jgi:hypothetical protein
MEAVRDDDTARRWLSRAVWLNRGELGLGHDAVTSWREQAEDRSRFLFKLTAEVRAALHARREGEWQGPGR